MRLPSGASALALLGAACTSVLADGPNQFNFSHVRLVELNPYTGNWLFRGGEPLQASSKPNASEFAYDEMKSVFTARAREHGLDFPDEFYFIDLSFLWHGRNEADIDAEAAIFRQHPELGELMLWPIYGVKYEDGIEAGSASVSRACKALNISHCPTSQPANFSAADRTLLTKNYRSWADHGNYLPERIAIVERHLDTRRDDHMPVVLYGHCECGCDRTGEFFGAWALHRYNQTFTQAMAANEDIVKPFRPGGHISYENQVALQWYCWHLQQSTRPELSDCSACERFRCSGD